MGEFLVRDLDPNVMDRLQRQARQHCRSLQAEVHRILGDATRLSREESLHLVDVMQAKSPPMPDSTPIIRELRDMP